MGGGNGTKGGFKGSDGDDMCSAGSLEPEDRYDSCCSNVCHPGRVLRDIIVGLLVVLGIAVIVAVIFALCFFLVPEADKIGERLVPTILLSEAEGVIGGPPPEPKVEPEAEPEPEVEPEAEPEAEPELEPIVPPEVEIDLFMPNENVEIDIINIGHKEHDHHHDHKHHIHEHDQLADQLTHSNIHDHDHSDHDHSGHDHSGHDHSGHDHSGHDHSNDHSNHDHDLDHMQHESMDKAQKIIGGNSNNQAIPISFPSQGTETDHIGSQPPQPKFDIPSRTKDTDLFFVPQNPGNENLFEPIGSSPGFEISSNNEVGLLSLPDDVPVDQVATASAGHLPAFDDSQTGTVLSSQNNAHLVHVPVNFEPSSPILDDAVEVITPPTFSPEPEVAELSQSPVIIEDVKLIPDNKLSPLFEVLGPRQTTSTTTERQSDKILTPIIIEEVANHVADFVENSSPAIVVVVSEVNTNDVPVIVTNQPEQLKSEPELQTTSIPDVFSVQNVGQEEVPDETVHDTSVSNGCHPKQLDLCTTTVAWSHSAMPNWVNDRNDKDLISSLDYFQKIVINSRCSARATEYACAVLEPPCSNQGTPLPPCRAFCRSVTSTCSEFLLKGVKQNIAFDCAQYPDSSDPNICVSHGQEPHTLGSIIGGSSSFPTSIDQPKILTPETWNLPFTFPVTTPSNQEEEQEETTILQFEEQTLTQPEVIEEEEEQQITNPIVTTKSSLSAALSKSGFASIIPLNTDLPETIPTTIIPILITESSTTECPQLKCLNGKCITIAQLDDGVRDCPDGSDEQGFRDILGQGR